MVTGRLIFGGTRHLDSQSEKHRGDAIIPDISPEIRRLNVTFSNDTASCRRPLIGLLAATLAASNKRRDFAPTTANRIETRKRQSYNSAVAIAVPRCSRLFRFEGSTDSHGVVERPMSSRRHRARCERKCISVYEDP